MNLAQQFNSLNGMIVSRKTLELLLEKAEKEKQTIISKRIIKVLEAFDDDKFLIEIQNLVEPFGLNGSDDVQGLLGGLDFFEGLNGYIQTEILSVKNEFKGKSNLELKIILNNAFIGFKDLKILNLETNKTITITKEVRKKTIFTGVGLNSELATAVKYLPHLIMYGKLVHTGEPKPHHKKKPYYATELYNFESKINIDGITKHFILTAFKDKKGNLLYYVESSDIKKSSRIPNSKNSMSKSAFPEGLDIKDISKGLNAPKKVTPKNKFGKNELVKVIYGECKNHIGKILHCSFDESNGVFYYDIENACKDEISENNLAVATVLKTVAKKVEVVAEPKKASGIFELSISNVKTDTARFQNRNKLNETVLDQIVENYSDTKMDPIIVWIDIDKKTYLLAGHHRFEATKRVGRKTIAAKYFQGSEAEAIKYAKLESNANRSLELPQERAKLYREMRTNGATKTAVSNEAKKLEGKNANYVLNLSYLQPKGVTISALDQLSETADKQNATLIEKIADWSGEARRNNDDLTNQHEKEIFDFLMDREASKRINSKSEFLQKIVAATGMYFDYETGLNLKRFKNQTEGESIYEAEYNELKNKIDSIIANRLALVDRIKNPNNKEYINPAKEKNYESILEALDKTVLKYNSELKAAQTKLIELSRKKGSYTNAGSNQVGLFGAKTNKNSLAYKMANKPTNIDFFKIEDQHIADFLGKIEHKKKESIVISLTGGQGSMKTRMCFQFINALAQNYKVGHASIEEHPESSLYYDKAEEYLNKKALQNIESPEIKSVSDLEKLIQKSEIIVIDSFSKMQEMQRGFEVDKDLRKKYDGKLFIVIFQQTTDGKMRGGSKSQFDADIVLFTEKKADYRENYIYADKNRYQNKPLDSLKFNIFSKKLVLDKTEELGEPTTNKKLSFKVN